MNWLTLSKALEALRAWSHWYRIVSDNPRYYPGLKILQKGFDSALSSLQSESRKTVVRMAMSGRCIACGEAVSAGAGDHIIPLSRGGPRSAENFMPLCKRCNASKGNKDLVEWWISKGRHIKELNLDALTVYLRLRYRLATEEELHSPAPGYLMEAVKQAQDTLPWKLYEKWRLKVWVIEMNYYP